MAWRQRCGKLIHTSKMVTGWHSLDLQASLECIAGQMDGKSKEERLVPLLSGWGTGSWVWGLGGGSRGFHPKIGMVSMTLFPVFLLLLDCFIGNRVPEKQLHTGGTGYRWGSEQFVQTTWKKEWFYREAIKEAHAQQVYIHKPCAFAHPTRSLQEVRIAQKLYALGFHILFSDADVSWMHDPLPYLKQLAHGMSFAHPNID
eukprot:1138208-Pelagomonas_calceolata.AAC.9